MSYEKKGSYFLPLVFHDLGHENKFRKTLVRQNCH